MKIRNFWNLFFCYHWMQLIVLRRKCTGPKPWILLAEDLGPEYFHYIRINLKTLGPTIFENAKFPKCLFLISLDAARAPDANSLIHEAWNLLAEEQEPEYIVSSKTMVLSKHGRSVRSGSTATLLQPYRLCLCSARTVRSATTLLLPFENPIYSKVPFFNIIGYSSSSLCLITNTWSLKPACWGSRVPAARTVLLRPEYSHGFARTL